MSYRYRSTAGPLRRATQSLVGASKTSSTCEPFKASRFTSFSRSSSTSWIIRRIVGRSASRVEPLRGIVAGSRLALSGNSTRPTACPLGPCCPGAAPPPSARPVFPQRRGQRMPQYLSPGVYVEEVEAGSRPIEGVGTAVAAFVGLAARGPANQPTLVTNWSQFTQTFGEFVENSYLAHAVYGYFLNGGGACYVVRVGSDGA